MLIGRQAERVTCRDILKQVVSGQGQILLLGGEAGIGKTRLVKDRKEFSTLS